MTRQQIAEIVAEALRAKEITVEVIESEGSYFGPPPCILLYLPNVREDGGSVQLAVEDAE
jgi:hypothetical protein